MTPTEASELTPPPPAPPVATATDEDSGPVGEVLAALLSPGQELAAAIRRGADR